MLRRELLTAAVSGLALGAGRDAGVAADLPFPHGRPIVSFATSPSGQWLVTGAECSDLHADDALEGVTCWDLKTLTPKWTTLLDGGVGLADQLRGGVRFSPDGTLVAANCHTNELAVLDAVSGTNQRTWSGSSADGPPAWCWSSDPSNPGALAVLAERKLTLVPRTGAPRDSGLAPLRPLTFDARGLTLLGVDALQRGTRRIPLSRKEGGALAVAVSETTLAVGSTGGELLLVDRETFTVRERHPVACSTLSFNAQGNALVAVRANRREAVVIRKGAVQAVPGPLAAHDWLAFADGQAVAVSPDGTRVATVTAPGEVFVQGARRGVVPGTVALTWPTDDRLVALGPRVVALIEPGAGVSAVRRLS